MDLMSSKFETYLLDEDSPSDQGKLNVNNETNEQEPIIFPKGFFSEL